MFERVYSALVRLMWMGREFETDNERWRVKVVRSAFPGHLSGWLTNKVTGNRYVFSAVGGTVRYMRSYKPPTNIPKYLDEYILDLREACLK